MQKQEPAGGTTLDTLQLDGWQLDYFTGLALGYAQIEGDTFKPTSCLEHLLEVLLKIRTLMWGGDGKVDWMARADGSAGFARGPSPEVAMCRAVVFAKFGKTVSLPGAVADDCGDLFA